MTLDEAEEAAVLDILNAAIIKVEGMIDDIARLRQELQALEHGGAIYEPARAPDSREDPEHAQ